MSVDPKQEPETSTTAGTSVPESAPLPPVPPADPKPRTTVKRAGRRKINIEFIEDKSRRHITFSKRKAGIMKKAYELSTLTGTQVLLLVASETGHVYTFATPKLQPLITKPEGKNLIQACLNAPDTLQPQNTNPHAAQMSPSTPGYAHQPDQHSMGMSQNDYHNQGSPAQSPYGQPDEDKNPMSYGLQRSSYGDVKGFQPSSPSQQEHMNEGSMGYPYPSGNQGLMGMGNGPRMPYHGGNNGPSLPTLSERGSFSNLPSSQHVPYNQFAPSGMPSNYSGPMGGGSTFSGSNFPSNGPSQLFKASNLPTLPRHDNL
jgi:hypothetical protein|uniref:MADS-box domain-containing protein n=1 Tax=Vannella robusta TaxID=1487602 RepID=A0A6U1VL92_9EUKA|mmetsp:Transcript_24237/g.30834  ORF Transcript_24237/g.30834 Transcript_24237/m.30834 type:complete len:315 (+) Transcript_24237:97-1041(+)